MEEDQPESKGFTSEQLDLLKAVLLLAVVVGGVLALWFYSDAGGREKWSPYWWSATIGVFVGATELISRYRDAPFKPLISLPGIFYLAINGLAAWLAYYLIVVLKIEFDHKIFSIMTAGLTAMAFFRSGVFTARLGDKDVSIGPNIILEVFLNALDRTYDRQRAAPRSRIVAQLMADLTFDESRHALPAMCFNLMQNVGDVEQTAIRAQVDQLATLEMSDEAKTLNLGLALFDVVGEETLKAAVEALGKTVRGFKKLPDEMIKISAKVDPGLVIDTLPAMCNELAAKRDAVNDPEALVAGIKGQNLPDETKAFMILYKLVRQYGEVSVMRVLAAMPES